mmetsp:Transcript_71082/g.208332  ORF Transcript_71082/g.208332 Transcript_71082/m.208332 type:complete len:258 (-) Transcript_71082:56-829(-)
MTTMASSGSSLSIFTVLRLLPISVARQPPLLLTGPSTSWRGGLCGRDAAERTVPGSLVLQRLSLRDRPEKPTFLADVIVLTLVTEWVGEPDIAGESGLIAFAALLAIISFFSAACFSKNSASISAGGGIGVFGDRTVRRKLPRRLPLKGLPPGESASRLALASGLPISGGCCQSLARGPSVGTFTGALRQPAARSKPGALVSRFSAKLPRMPSAVNEELAPLAMPRVASEPLPLRMTTLPPLPPWTLLPRNFAAKSS